MHVLLLFCVYTTRKTPKPGSAFPILPDERDGQHHQTSSSDTEHLPNLRSTTQKALRANQFKSIGASNLIPKAIEKDVFGAAFSEI